MSTYLVGARSLRLRGYGLILRPPPQIPSFATQHRALFENFIQADVGKDLSNPPGRNLLANYAYRLRETQEPVRIFRNG
jgi:hypothetical protein